MFEELFMQKRLSSSKLMAYGFTYTDGVYRYTCPILNGEFFLHVTFDRFGNPDTSMTECDTGEEYILYKTAAEGTYIGIVREAIAEVLRGIVDQCFDSSTFRQTQTMQLLAHAAEAFGDEPEFLWADSPDCAILRRKDSSKWYAVIMTVPKSKLGFDTDIPVEILNLHGTPDAVECLLRRADIYSGWHMNKKSWYTVILDGSVDNGELFAFLAESYRLAGKLSKTRKSTPKEDPS